MSPRKLTFGYLYDFRNPPQWHRPWHRLYGEMLDAIAWSESAGFSPAWVPEHHMAGDGYIGAEAVCDAYVARLQERGEDVSSARVTITGITTVVAEDPEATFEELAPYFHHVNNSYGEWFCEDQVHAAGHGFTPMSLEQFKDSGTLQVITPDAAIAMLHGLRARMPLEHYIFSVPAGLPVDRFVHYARTVADKVMPAFA
jgi:hypothetical protein